MGCDFCTCGRRGLWGEAPRLMHRQRMRPCAACGRRPGRGRTLPLHSCSAFVPLPLPRGQGNPALRFLRGGGQQQGLVGVPASNAMQRVDGARRRSRCQAALLEKLLHAALVHHEAGAHVARYDGAHLREQGGGAALVLWGGMGRTPGRAVHAGPPAPPQGHGAGLCTQDVAPPLPQRRPRRRIGHKYLRARAGRSARNLRLSPSQGSRVGCRGGGRGLGAPGRPSRGCHAGRRYGAVTRHAFVVLRNA